MFMRIVWGKILPGKWAEFEAAFKSAMAARGDLKGLKNHWLARDQEDPEAGYSITLWDLRIRYASVLGQPKAQAGNGAARTLLRQPIHEDTLRGEIPAARLTGGDFPLPRVSVRRQVFSDRSRRCNASASPEICHALD